MKRIMRLSAVLTISGMAVGLAAVPADAAPVHQFLNHHNRKCLEIADSGTGNGDDAQQWSCNMQPGAFWYLRKVGQSGQHGIYEIRNRHSGKCLEAENSSTGNGTTVQQWTCRGQAGTRWWFNYSGSGYFLIRLFKPRPDGRRPCLEISDSSDDNGAPAQIWTCDGQQGSHWRMT